jgi:hypothetical protein
VEGVVLRVEWWCTTVATRPSGHTARKRWLAESAMKDTPAPSTATPVGDEK